MEISYTATPQDYRALADYFWKDHSHGRFWLRVLWLPLSMLLLLFVIPIAFSLSYVLRFGLSLRQAMAELPSLFAIAFSSDVWSWGLPLTFFFVLSQYYFRPPWAARRMLATAAPPPTKISLSTDSYCDENPGARQDFSWERVARVVEARGLLIFIHKPDKPNGICSFAPRRAFPNEAAYAGFRDEAMRLHSAQSIRFGPSPVATSQV